MWKLVRPDAVKVWDNPEIRERFKRYWRIMHDEVPARYLIAKKVPVHFSPDANLASLLKIHGRFEPEFHQNLKSIGESLDNLAAAPEPAQSYLDLKIAIALRVLESCCFCERRCGVNRKAGETGVCGIDDQTYVSSAFPHMGEESPLVPSGTIFFTGCTFHCVFCQNFDISQEWRHSGRKGSPVNARQLADIAEDLGEQGVRNINYVGGDPTSNAHIILGSLKYQTRNITQLWNSNFYISTELVRVLGDLMDFWLPDFKYGNDDCARKYSKVENYWPVLTRNHQWIYDKGSGEIIIRHLVMPNHIECCTKPILDWIAGHIPHAVVNIMGQYRPEYLAHKYPEINRRPSSEETAEAKKYATELGILWEPVS